MGTANGKKIREFRTLAKEQIKGWPTGVWAGRGQTWKAAINFPADLSHELPHPGPLPLDMMLYTMCCPEQHTIPRCVGLVQRHNTLSQGP